MRNAQECNRIPAIWVAIMINIPEDLISELSLSPVERITHGRHGRRVSSFPSRKNRAGVMCDSILESDFCLELERRRPVKNYTSQPFRITHLKTQTSYIPDFEVSYNNGRTELFEVKTETRYQKGKNSGKLELFASILRDCGYSLEIALDSAIRHTVKTSNLRTLYHQGYTVSDAESDRFKSDLKQWTSQELTISRLLALGIEPKIIAHALFYEILLTDLSRPLTVHAMVRVSPEYEHAN